MLKTSILSLTQKQVKIPSDRNYKTHLLQCDAIKKLPLNPFVKETCFKLSTKSLNGSLDVDRIIFTFSSDMSQNF